MTTAATHESEAPLPAPLIRTFAWAVVGAMFAYLVNCYLSFWQDWPGVLGFLDGTAATAPLAWVQLALYVLAIVGAGYYAFATNQNRSLRQDAEALNAISVFIICAAFWAVLLIGFVDAFISFLRVEGMLEAVFGENLAKELGRSQFRGPYVHMPLVALGILIAVWRRTIDFIWLALLVVIAELAIVVTRFIFSYEQAFMGDLVRFWYAGLFLFASAYTLYTDTHVRVDVFYAGFSRPTRGKVNAVGAILLGLIFCWTILIMGMWTENSILITPLKEYEISQSGYGMYVKYLMASFLGIFAVTMTIQFASALLEGVADARKEPGAREMGESASH